MEKVCLGVDVGGTNLRCAVVSDKGEVFMRVRFPTEIDNGRAYFLDTLHQALAGLVLEAEALGKTVVAVGLGVPGLISNSGLVHNSVNLQPLVGLNITEAVSQRLGLPVVSLNDANASALGEQRYGAGRHYRSVLVLTLGTGVGSGLILDGRLWTGADGIAAEFGHATVEPLGRRCRCGNVGCLEQYASATAIANTATEMRRFGTDVVMTADAVGILAANGNPHAIAVFNEAGRYLGIAAATVANLLNLEALILTGGVAESFDLLVEPMRREMVARAFEIPGARMNIIKGELGDDSGILGATAIAFDLLAGR
ncbi:ROK family protein [Geomonas sp. RF6]|uniref:ROK family protein n=1 Tax=Geomonas sp. RF6 TaxID=2897342 RepID=UPI001E5F5F24|nr:ROK family protein [Geomonas sp. RF6]UFS70822.1 ROK family protein [Geomonas sp. RF6]